MSSDYLEGTILYSIKRVKLLWLYICANKSIMMFAIIYSWALLGSGTIASRRNVALSKITTQKRCSVRILYRLYCNTTTVLCTKLIKQFLPLHFGLREGNSRYAHVLEYSPTKLIDSVPVTFSPITLFWFTILLLFRNNSNCVVHSLHLCLLAYCWAICMFLN